MAKKYDSDITGWITVNNRRVPLRAKKYTEDNGVYKYELIKQSIKRLASDRYADGTYDAHTLELKDYKNGYQVSYCQIGDRYTKDEHDELIRKFLEYTDDKIVSLGKFGGTPEHSFHVLSKAIAIRLAKKYNQKSVWDWKWYQKALEYEAKYGEDDPRTIKAWAMCEINTGGTGERGK